MKIENDNGLVYIKLEKDEKILIGTPSSCSTIKIENENNNLNILGSSSIINTIKGNGMLEKVYIPSTVSSEEIIKKCDEWLEKFKKVHDIFRDLVLTDKYKKQYVTMHVSFVQYLYSKDDYGFGIDIDLLQNGIIIQEGLTIKINKTNKNIYNYLIANVLDYYISKNYKDTKTNDYLNYQWNQILFSKEAPTKLFESSPIAANLSILYESQDTRKIVDSLLAAHNLDNSSNQIIDKLKNRITTQALDDDINNTIEYSNRQYNHIIANSDKEKVFKKDNK